MSDVQLPPGYEDAKPVGQTTPQAAAPQTQTPAPVVAQSKGVSLPSGYEDARPVQSKSTQSTDTIGPAPTGVVPWFENVENDLLHGGGRTVVGRTLGRMQGESGDKGYSGLESGVGEDVGKFMGSPLLGTTQALKGIAEIGTGHPVKGAGDVVGGTAKAATIPSAFAVGPEGSAVAEGAGDAIKAGASKVPEMASKTGDLAADALTSVKSWWAGAQSKEEAASKLIDSTFSHLPAADQRVLSEVAQKSTTMGSGVGPVRAGTSIKLSPYKMIENFDNLPQTVREGLTDADAVRQTLVSNYHKAVFATVAKGAALTAALDAVGVPKTITGLLKAFF